MKFTSSRNSKFIWIICIFNSKSNICFKLLQLPWMLAGGLDCNNVANAIKISAAKAVDVSSGVESYPGKKDAEQIHAFIRAAQLG